MVCIDLTGGIITLYPHLSGLNFHPIPPHIWESSTHTFFPPFSWETIFPFLRVCTKKEEYISLYYSGASEIKDTLGPAILSFVGRVSSSRRFKTY